MLLICSLILGIVFCSSVSAVNSTNETVMGNQSTGSATAYSMGKTLNSYSSKQLHVTKTVDLTDAEYSYYFDNQGLLKNDAVNAGDTLKLYGNFYSKNMTIDIPVNIIGYGAVLYNGTIKIIENGSGTNISNIKIKNDNQKGIIIYESENNTIKNNTVVVNQESESYAIYLHDSRNNRIISNDITATGNYITYGMLLYESYNNEIKSNKVKVVGTSVLLPYTSSILVNKDIGDIKEIFPTYGILLLFSSDNRIVGNDVILKSGFSTPVMPNKNCMNSMVGIDIYYDSHNNEVINNNITVNGKNPYSYGLGVLGSLSGTNDNSAENNVFSYNNINVNGSYFATGFIAGPNSLNTTLKGNNINVSSDIYSYGITLEASKESKLIENKVSTTAVANYIIELFASNGNLIEGNELAAAGTFSYGIAGYRSSQNNITKNKIFTVENSENTSDSCYHDDIIPWGNAGIYLMSNSGNNTISFNKINNVGLYTVNDTGSCGNVVINNYLISDNGNKRGNDAVASDGIVNSNYGEMLSADFKVNTIKGNAPLTVQFTDQSIGNVTGWTWYFGDGGTSTQKNPSHIYAVPGLYTVKLVVTNGMGYDEIIKADYISITDNKAPVFDDITDKVINENKQLQFTVNATDQDGDNLIYTVSNLPRGANFNQVTGVFTWTPTYAQSGSYQVIFTVSDDNLTDSRVVHIVVNNNTETKGDNNVNIKPTTSRGVIGVHSVAASTDSLPLQKTGLPVECLVLAVLMVGGGFTLSWRK